MLRFSTLAASVTLALLAMPALAALPTGKLEFVQRTGTVNADEVIPVMMRLTLDEDSAPLTFSSNPLTGFSTDDLPTEGRFFNPDLGQFETRPFVEVIGAFLNTYYSCQGDFTVGCGPSASYRFEFNIPGSPAHPSINFLDSFELAPGASFEYTFGFFVPQAGGAAPGVYRWNGTAVTLNFQGLDVDGNVGDVQGTEINSGFSLDPGVAFERTVVAIPEPSTYVLMAAGLALVGGLARRRRGKAD